MNNTSIGDDWEPDLYWGSGSLACWGVASVRSLFGLALGSPAAFGLAYRGFASLQRLALVWLNRGVARQQSAI